MRRAFAIIVAMTAFGLLMVQSAAPATKASITAGKAGSSAAIQLYRPFPEGIDGSNKTHALNQIQSRAAWDPQYAETIARQTGRSQYKGREYRALGYGNDMPGTTNSGVDAYGSVVPVADHNGSDHVKVLIVINVVTQKTVAFMVRCGNPRLRPYTPPVAWKPFRVGTVVSFARTVTKPITLSCPSGQKVSGFVKADLRGTVRARTWGKVQGSLTAKLNAKVNLGARILVKLSCGPAPEAPPGCTIVINNSPGAQANCNGIVVGNCNGVQNCNNTPPPPTTPPPSNPPAPPSPPPTSPPPPKPPTDVCPNLPDVQTAVPAGYVKDSNGNCVQPPPTNVTVSAATSVQSQKSMSQPCPDPNQGIIKHGNSDTFSLTSPTFTGTGSTQAAANTDLQNKLTQWKKDNQPTVDKQANDQAQSRLNTDLQSCPPPPQPKPDTDLCINLDGVQTAVPAGYQKDPPDPGVPGNCVYVGP